MSLLQVAIHIYKRQECLKSTHPQIAKEWSEKNYPLQPDEVNAKSRKNVWWHLQKMWKQSGNQLSMPV
ncbi:MAG: zinc-ribbon domain-containing protein [Dorea sp.]